MNDVVRENLTKARGLVEKGWGQHAYSRTSDGCTTTLWDEEASCFCTMGALYRAVGKHSISEHLVQDEIKALGFQSEGQVLTWNDDEQRTLKHVLNRFDLAIGGLAA